MLAHLSSVAVILALLKVFPNTLSVPDYYYHVAGCWDLGFVLLLHIVLVKF